MPCTRQLLAAGASVTSACASDGATALFLCCAYGFVEVAELLIGATSDAERQRVLDHRQAAGGTPLYSACQNGHAQVAALLVNAGAEVSLADDQGRTPLYAGCAFGSDACVALLLAAGAHRV